MDLLTFTDKGIYCPQADVYIDPWHPVKRALITHGHADHSRWGNKYYLCTHSAKPVIRYRLGSNINIDSVAYGEDRLINRVRFSFHPAGHIIGSAQIRVEYKGEIWVASGDYKIQPDGLSENFETVPCHSYITESTFGLPVYKWPSQHQVFEDINNWWLDNQHQEKVTILTAYSLGKAQRILHNLDQSIGPIYTHGAVENINEVIRKQKIKLPETIRVSQDIPKANFKGAMIICPPGAIGTSWMKKFYPYSVGIASGWMALRGTRRRRAVDRGFVLSDHADWEGLNKAILATGAEQVFVTHGYTNIFSKWLESNGLNARPVETRYEGELAEMNESTSEDENEGKQTLDKGED